MYDLAAFKMTDKIAIAADLRRIASEVTGVADAAERVVRYFRGALVTPETGEPSCALVRLYLTAPFASLDEDRRAFARDLLGLEPPAETRCLTLMATAGDEPEWNSVATSRGHKAIPLASEEMVRALPMIAQLITQLGVGIGAVLEPDPTILVHVREADYNVFYVPVAPGSPYIPAQAEFVDRYGVASVLGFGGLMPSGDLSAVVLFSKRAIPHETARLFKTFALSLKSVLLAGVLADDERRNRER